MHGHELRRVRLALAYEETSALFEHCMEQIKDKSRKAPVEEARLRNEVYQRAAKISSLIGGAMGPDQFDNGRMAFFLTIREAMGMGDEDEPMEVLQAVLDRLGVDQEILGV